VHYNRITIDAIVFAPSDPSVVYAGLADDIECIRLESLECGQGSGVIVSHDGGTSWQPAVDDHIRDAAVTDLAVDPTNAQIVYAAATGTGLFKTTDGGANWTPININGVPAGIWIRVVTVSPANPQHVLAGVREFGIYVSTDGGETWQAGYAGLEPNGSIQDVVFDPTNPQVVYAVVDLSTRQRVAHIEVGDNPLGSGLIDGQMNCSISPADCANHPPNQGRSYDLDCLAAFMDSLRVPLSPAHTCTCVQCRCAPGEPLTEAEQRGQTIFNDLGLGCIACHPPPLYTDQQTHDVDTATADERIGPEYDTPTLRGLYDSAPYFHDGSVATLHEAITYPSPGSEHDVSGLLNEAEIQDLIAFLLALPFEE